MPGAQGTLWDRFLAPVVRSLIDEEALRRFYESVDWEAESARLGNPNLSYPDYYRSANFHGIEGGYRNPQAAVTYDAITQYAVPPNEQWVRQEAIDTLAGQPQRILDLGCGTGSMALMLQRQFPQAEVMGLDLSPYMLVVAERKAHQANASVRWYQGKAEATGLPEGSLDWVTAALLFHETPPAIARAILQEGLRLLRPGGEFLVLDGHQAHLQQADWVMDVFEEPYIRDYAAGDCEAWMAAAGFEAVDTHEIWWIHQATRGVKPLPARQARPHPGTATAPEWPDAPAPA